MQATLVIESGLRARVGRGRGGGRELCLGTGVYVCLRCPYQKVCSLILPKLCFPRKVAISLSLRVTFYFKMYF